METQIIIPSSATIQNNFTRSSSNNSSFTFHQRTPSFTSSPSSSCAGNQNVGGGGGGGSGGGGGGNISPADCSESNPLRMLRTGAFPIVPIPLPPRDRSKPSASPSKPRHQRKHPLIIPGQGGGTFCLFFFVLVLCFFYENF